MAVQRLRKNDTVIVIGGKERGKTGTILRVIPDRDRVVIERLNLVKRHMKPRGVQQQGGIVEKEASIHISDVMLVCPKCGKATRTSVLVLGDGSKARQCKKCKEMLSDQD